MKTPAAMYLFIYLFNRRMLLKHCGKSKRGLSYVIIIGLHSKTHHQSAISFSPHLFILSSYELICSASLHALIHHTGKGRCLVLMCERFHQVAPCSKFTVHSQNHQNFTTTVNVLSLWYSRSELHSM